MCNKKENKNLQMWESETTRVLIHEGLWEKGWRFRYDNAIRRAGSCSHYRKMITMSRHYVKLNGSNDVEIYNTILHEVAHALAPSEEGHGRIWKRIFNNLLHKWEQPINTSRCYDGKVKMPESRYHIKCKGCGYKWKRNRMSRRRKQWLVTGATCRTCKSGPFEIKDNGRIWAG